MAVATADLLIFTRQFSSMVRSNLHLVDALDSLARETTKRGLRAALADVLVKVRSGRDFDKALADHPHVFNPTYVGVVRAGLQSGQLGDALQQITEYLGNLDTIMKKIRGAAIYPAMLMLAFLITFHIMIFGILPRFEKLFTEFGHDLPAPTRIVLGVGNIYALVWPQLLSIGLLSAAAFLIWRRTSRLSYDRIKLSIPLIGPLLRLSALARFAHTLAIQVQNSVSLIEAIRIAAPASNNRFVEASLEQIARDIEHGEPITRAFAKHELFRGVVQQMISAGDQTGQLGEPLRSVAIYFESVWVQRLEAVIAVINPALTIIMGLLISGMLIAAFLPVFEVSGVAVR